MSHKTLVNGTVYEVDGGKTLIDGVAYSIDKGKTLVGGTAYEVGFVEMATITITGDGGSYYAYATIDGTRYGSATSLEVPVGTVISCEVYDEENSDSYITVNGNYVYYGSSGIYEHTVTGNATINLAVEEISSGGRESNYGYIEITEE